VGALIALGAGFNPILTGRENIYINGSVLGLSKKEIDEKLGEIIDFSEIGEFIDTPVQNYSSGMSVRLGFAIASSLSPDVLILDEVLAVGDIGFVIKCLNRVRKLTSNAAVILVSHNMQSISSFCSRVMFMDHGSAVLDTAHPAEAIDCYYEMIRSEKNETGAGGASIRHIALGGGTRIKHGTQGRLSVELEIDGKETEASVNLYIMDEAMMPVICMPVTVADGSMQRYRSGIHRLDLDLGVIDLVSGKYSFTLSIFDPVSSRVLLRSQGLEEFRVFADHAHWGRMARPIIVECD
ncbi:MAG: ABC transporter ATP-binding protein, partial [Chthoniobacterales bacterium]|nr:ABC transporter ATP-binding protein [Chthoniobacterales bacterium]